MAETVAQLVTAIVDEASFDVTSSQALVWLNRSWRTMLGRARAYRKTVSLGTTVANDATYDAPAGIVELYSVEVAGVPYGRARREDVYWDTQGRLVWTGQGETGLFYPDATAAAVSSITLIPAPTTAGQAMTGLAATYPPDLTSDATGDTLLVAYADNRYEGLIAGAMAIGYRREGNAGLRADAKTEFDQETEELRRDVKRRYRGPGPTQIRVEMPR
jgi:hypothetical protein